MTNQNEALSQINTQIFTSLNESSQLRALGFKISSAPSSIDQPVIYLGGRAESLRYQGVSGQSSIHKIIKEVIIYDQFGSNLRIIQASNLIKQLISQIFTSASLKSEVMNSLEQGRWQINLGYEIWW